MSMLRRLSTFKSAPSEFFLTPCFPTCKLSVCPYYQCFQVDKICSTPLLTIIQSHFALIFFNLNALFKTTFGMALIKLFVFFLLPCPVSLYPLCCSAEKKWFTDESENAYPRNIQIKPMSTHMANQINQYKSTSSLIPPIREVEDECWLPEGQNNFLKKEKGEKKRKKVRNKDWLHEWWRDIYSSFMLNHWWQKIKRKPSVCQKAK